VAPVPEQAITGYRETGFVRRSVRRTAATRAMAKVYGVIQQPTDRFVYRASGGRTTLSSWMAGVKITMLTTTGARSGKPRTLPVMALPDGDGMILIASNFGRPRHPAWYHNLRANPRATVVFEGVERELGARELSGEEREAAYARGEEIYPGFTYYRTWAAPRVIPVLRLEPV
jgi:deazaflavin-dependent oxidoreductase (nitroreductase family)